MLTLAPYDRRLINEILLSDEEREQINAYHARVLAEIGPDLDAAGRAWLQEACEPI
jgi:Xaa-Pro aminopeptidase